jgi:hypothetical protein
VTQEVTNQVACDSASLAKGGSAKEKTKTQGGNCLSYGFGCHHYDSELRPRSCLGDGGYLHHSTWYSWGGQWVGKKKLQKTTCT